MVGIYLALPLPARPPPHPQPPTFVTLTHTHVTVAPIPHLPDYPVPGVEPVIVERLALYVDAVIYDCVGAGLPDVDVTIVGGGEPLPCGCR